LFEAEILDQLFLLDQLCRDVVAMIMAAAALLKNKPKPTDADIDGAITNICRCGTFQQVRAAIHAAAANA
jgi:aerobic-type carbon monoxide dehydrogenase small subunit (CoxS/CutS family)